MHPQKKRGHIWFRKHLTDTNGGKCDEPDEFNGGEAWKED